MKEIFCGRKGKFGLNCQAVSNVHGRILDISLDHWVHLRTALHLREVIFTRGWRAGY